MYHQVLGRRVPDGPYAFCMSHSCSTLRWSQLDGGRARPDADAAYDAAANLGRKQHQFGTQICIQKIDPDEWSSDPIMLDIITIINHY